MNCKNHQEKLAVYQCANCKNPLCETCVMIRRFTDEFTAYICKECGGKCDLILAEASKEKGVKPKLFAAKPKEIKVRDEKTGKDKTVTKPREISSVVVSNYWLCFLGAFIFPLWGKGIPKIILGTAFFYGLSEITRISPLTGTLLSIPCVTYLVFYLFRIIEDTLKGESRLPKLPDMNYWVEDAGIVIYFSFALVTYFAPANIYFIFAKNFNWPYFFLLGLGVFALPIVVIRIAIERKLSALNPIIVFSAIGKIFFPYVVTFLLMASFKFLIFYVNDAFLFDYEWIGYLGLQFLIVYKLFVEMRVLGTFGRFYQEKIISLAQK